MLWARQFDTLKSGLTLNIYMRIAILGPRSFIAKYEDEAFNQK